MSSKNPHEHLILKVHDGDTIYVDLNDNGSIEKDEKIRLYGIDTFETSNNKHLKEMMSLYNLSEEEALELGNLAKEFATEKLLNKKVKVKFTGGKTQGRYRRRLGYIVINDEDFGEMLLTEGLAVVYRKVKHKHFDRYVELENLEKLRARVKKTEETTSSDLEELVVFNFNTKDLLRNKNCVTKNRVFSSLSSSF